MTLPAYGTAQIECAECNWTGTEHDMKRVPHATFKDCDQQVCPKCGCDGYYFADQSE